ncbi:MAG: DNA-formamidopyrimidine glycosylase family protein, partial [Myxococcota bacterium]
MDDAPFRRASWAPDGAIDTSARMPEGHTIHRLARDHDRWFAGGSVTLTSPQGRFEEGARALSGRTVRTVDAYGKHLFYHFEGGPILHVHLGLFGRFRMRKRPGGPLRGSPRMVLGNHEREVRLSGPTACEILTRTELKAIHARLGPDPLRPRAPGKRFVDEMARRRRQSGAVLLDQSLIAGVGNVYRSELLYLAGVHPLTPCHAVPRTTWTRVWHDAKALLAIGVTLNRIVTVDPAERGRRTPRQLVRGERV